MSKDKAERPIIIKRKKVVGGDGHHGGAWKVAYADFVTAMMAFFMLMWLLNATTEKQRKGLADYFNPTIPINRVSGGGDGAFGGETMFSESTAIQRGTGGTLRNPGESRQSMGQTGTSVSEERDGQGLEQAEEALMGKGGDSMVAELALQHVQTKLTDEGLVIELFDLEESPLFVGETDEPSAMLLALAEMIVEMSTVVDNRVAVSGFIRAQPVVVALDATWDLSTARAHQMRHLLEAAGMSPARVQRVTGWGNRKPAIAPAISGRNNRLEVILLRSDQ